MNTQEHPNNVNNTCIPKMISIQLDHLNRGDHVCWFRRWGIYHHAIVDRVDIETKDLHIIHSTKKKVKRETIKAEKERDPFYLFEYSKEILDDNPPEKVLERACSKIDQTNYNLLRNNCEHFATFCKTGTAFSTQVEWTCAATTEMIKHGCRRVMELALDIDINQLSEMFDNGVYGTNVALFLAFEAYRCIKDINEYQQKHLQGVDILEATIKRVIIRTLNVGLAIIFAIAAAKAVGEALGSGIIPFIFNIIGGMLGLFRGRALGVFLFSLFKHIFMWVARRG